VVVVQDLEAKRLRPLANGVELIGHAPVVVERASAILRDGSNSGVAPPDLVRRLADLLRPIAQRVEIHMHGRRRESVPVETLTHLARGMPKESAPREAEVLRGLRPPGLRRVGAERVRPEELDLPVAETREHGERAIEVLLERLGKREQPNADWPEPIWSCTAGVDVWCRAGGGATSTPASDSDGSGGTANGDEEFASARHWVSSVVGYGRVGLCNVRPSNPDAPREGSQTRPFAASGHPWA
jgi:hypothetical protein